MTEGYLKGPWDLGSRGLVRLAPSHRGPAPGPDRSHQPRPTTVKDAHSSSSDDSPTTPLKNTPVNRAPAVHGALTPMTNNKEPVAQPDSRHACCGPHTARETLLPGLSRPNTHPTADSRTCGANDHGVTLYTSFKSTTKALKRHPTLRTCRKRPAARPASPSGNSQKPEAPTTRTIEPQQEGADRNEVQKLQRSRIHKMAGFGTNPCHQCGGCDAPEKNSKRKFRNSAGSLSGSLKLRGPLLHIEQETFPKNSDCDCLPATWTTW